MPRSEAKTVRLAFSENAEGKCKGYLQYKEYMHGNLFCLHKNSSKVFKYSQCGCVTSREVIMGMFPVSYNY